MLTPDAQMKPAVPVITHPSAELGRREKSLLVGRDGFPARVEDTGDAMGGQQVSADKTVAALLQELIELQRETLNWMQENIR